MGEKRLKDAYYFSHDSNANVDPKCVLLIEQLGPEGYGIFWLLIETLRDQTEHKYPLALLGALARRYNTTTEKMSVVVRNYGLFQIENEEFFYSSSLNRRMLHLDEKREKARLAGVASAEKRKLLNECSTSVEQTLNDRSTIKVKESKVNKSIFIKPTVQEVKNYCVERKNNIKAEKWFNHYESNGWMVGKNKMKDWKASVRTWEQSDTNQQEVKQSEWVTQ